MSENIIFRQEKKSDFLEVFEINRLAFGQDEEAKLVNALRNNPTVFIPKLSIVAVKDNAVVGHILFTKIKIKDKKGNLHSSLALAPMAISPKVQKMGIGSKLITNGLNTAQKLGYQSVIVLGHEHYYPKFGFLPANGWSIKSPFDVSLNAFMALELTPNSLQNISGIVIYPKEFKVT